jgi:hypothetical protein
MASVTRQNIANYTYLYESHSFRDQRGRPRNRKIKIGKLDPKTGKARYTEEYLDRMMKAGTPLPISPADPLDGLEEKIRNALNSLRDYGLFYFLKYCVEKTGLLEILKESFPRHWGELCMTSFYLIAQEKPLMYLEDWIGSTESFPVGNMNSQRISELLSAFGQRERNGFYTRWATQNSSKEYLALDITSISSYSDLIPDCEMGYNRDGENLPQINLCLLFGEERQLPVYQSLYSGSLMDSATFKTTIGEMKAVSGGKKLILVMDKGFYSEKNIKTLLREEPSDEFFIAVPFTVSYARELVEKERVGIDRAANIVKTSSSPLRGVNRTVTVAGHPLTAHILYNPERHTRERNELFAHVAGLKEAVETKQAIPTALRADVEKYLEVKGGDPVDIREDVLDHELARAGWVVIIGNGELSVQQAHDIYRKKDVVEKAFMKYKNSLGMGRLRVHDDERVKNKALIAFISLILVSYMHKTMKEKELYRRMTMNRLLLTMAKLKIVAIEGRHILRPITKEQKEIFSAFSIPLPLVG